MMLRIGGFGAVAGGVLWFAALAAASTLGGDDAAWLALLALGTLGILLALVGLSAFQAHRDPILAWAAFAIPGVGCILSMIGIGWMVLGPGTEPTLGSYSAWSVWMVGLLATLIGSVIFAVATIRAAVFSRWAAIALAASSTMTLVVGFGLFSLGEGDPFAPLVVAVLIGSFAASWIGFGVMALRRGPIRAIAPV